MYEVGKVLYCHLYGRPIPNSGCTRQRAKGVDLVLNGPAVSGWKAEGRNRKLGVYGRYQSPLGYRRPSG